MAPIYIMSGSRAFVFSDTYTPCKHDGFAEVSANKAAGQILPPQQSRELPRPPLAERPDACVSMPKLAVLCLLALEH